MQVKEIMTPNPEYVLSTATIYEAAKKMKELDTGFLPIGDKEKDIIIGTLTDRDIVISAIVSGKDANTEVKNVMNKGVEYCFETDSVEDASKKMKDKQIRRLIVLNKDKRLTGVLSLGDIALSCENKISGDTLEDISKHSS